MAPSSPRNLHCPLSNCLSYPKKEKEKRKKKLRGRGAFLFFLSFFSSPLPPACAKEVMRLDQMRTKPSCPPFFFFLLPSSPSLWHASGTHYQENTAGFQRGFFFFFFNLLQIKYRQQQLSDRYQKKCMRGGFTLGTIGSESLQAVN